MIGCCGSLSVTRRSEAVLVKKNAVVLGKLDCSPDTEACQIVLCIIWGYSWRSGESLAAGVRNAEAVSSGDLLTFRSFLGTIPDGPLSRKLIYL